MGHHIPRGQEAETLRTLISDARAVAKELRAALHEAALLAPRLTTEYEAHHLREITQLSDHMQREMNRASAQLNTAVLEARRHVLQMMTTTEMVIDRDVGTVHLVWPNGKFDETAASLPPKLVKTETQK